MGPSLVAPAAPRRSSRPEMPSAVGLTQHRFMAAPRVLIFINGSRLTVPAPPTLLPCSVAAVSVRSRSMIATRSSAQQATST